MKLYSLAALILGLASTSVLANQADDFAKLSHQQALKQANAEWKTGKMSAQVFADHIVAKFPDNSEANISTQGEHLLSIAPYINSTHPCGFHVPTGCTGELQNVAMQVKVVDLDSNQVLQYGQVKTLPNGFIDFWLPKGKQNLEFTFNYQGKTVTEILSTKDNARTCITTMQLI